MFTAEQVWGLAVAADRINQGYYKYPVRDQATGEVITRENKSMVKEWLQQQRFDLIRIGLVGAWWGSGRCPGGKGRER